MTLLCNVMSAFRASVAFLLVTIGSGFTYLQQCAAIDSAVDENSKYGRLLDRDEQLRVLDMLALQMRGNYEQIVTWAGEYEFSDRHRVFNGYPEPSEFQAVQPNGTPPNLNQGEISTGKGAGSGYWMIYKGSFLFALDNTNGNYHVFYNSKQPTGLLDVATGTERFWKGTGPSIHWVMTTEHALVFDLSLRKGQFPDYPIVESVPRKGGRIVYRKTPDKGRGYNSYYYDTRSFFKYGGSQWQWDYREKQAAWLRGEKGNRFQESVEKNMKIFASQDDPPTYTEVYTRSQDNSSTISVYDGKSGFNMTGHTFISDKKREVTNMTFRNISGVFIPESYTRDTYPVIDGVFLPTNHRSFKLLDMKLNGKISGVEFGVDQFHLVYGERMLDEIKSRMFVYDEKLGFVPAEEFVVDPARLKSDDTKVPLNANRTPAAPLASRTGSRTLMIANGVILLALVGVYLFRRYRTSNK